MRYVSLAGNWLVQALLDLRPQKESTPRFLARFGKRLQKSAGLDRETVKRMLSDRATVTVPLFMVVILAREAKCSVERLLFGTDEPDFDDPNLFTPEDRAEIRSASSLATMLEGFHVDFPIVLWQYAFPVHRKGTISEIDLAGWLALYLERFGRYPDPRSE